jgi:hypothetical protein
MSRWDGPPPPSSLDRWFFRNLRWIQLGFALAGLAALVMSIAVGSWTFVPIAVLGFTNVLIAELNARRQRRTWQAHGMDLHD